MYQHPIQSKAMLCQAVCSPWLPCLTAMPLPFDPLVCLLHLLLPFPQTPCAPSLCHHRPATDALRPCHTQPCPRHVGLWLPPLIAPLVFLFAPLAFLFAPLAFLFAPHPHLARTRDSPCVQDAHRHARLDLPPRHPLQDGTALACLR